MIADPRARRTSKGFVLPGGLLLEGSGEEGGYSPEDLRSAYKIPETGGAGQTVAVVDPGGYEKAESDLATYRSRYGLPPCTKANGCLKIVNQYGNESPLPAQSPWFVEQALDLDMVSAACQECHILLVQGAGEGMIYKARIANEAWKLHADEITNSYGYDENSSECGKEKCSQYAVDYDQVGIDQIAGAGDSGYDKGAGGEGAPLFPASAPDVIAVGGTTLRRAENARGWTETVWEESYGSRLDATGSGCSVIEPKPAWQTDPGCPRKMTADVAIDANWETPVSFYRGGEWGLSGGTSLGSPLFAGILAHANGYTRWIKAEAFYRKPEMFFDVTSGKNGECGTLYEYFCTAEVGYDGPTGLGAPDGVPNLEEP